MTPLSRTPAQVLRVATRVGGAFVDPEVAPTATAVLVNGQARNLAVGRARIRNGHPIFPVEYPGQYAFTFDGSSLRLGDLVEILFRTRAEGRALDGCVRGRVCRNSGYGAPNLVNDGPLLPPPGPGDGPLWDSTTVARFVGNSYTQQFDIPAAITHLAEQRVVGWSGSLAPPPVLGTTISSSAVSGYYPGMSLGGMTLFPSIDQRQGGSMGSTDAIDALASLPAESFDTVVLTSGFIQEETGVDGIEFETVPGGASVVLEVKRRVVAELATRLGSLIRVVVRMTHEGFIANTDPDLTQVEDFVRRQVLGARQLEAEGIVARVVAEAYVRSRLQYGAFGPVGNTPSDPVPAYVGLTHPQSTQPGNRNYGWLNRTQGDTPPFAWNGHHNALAAVVAAWTWGYQMLGLDPRGDTSFATPAGLPFPLSAFISGDGRIYGGHQTGLGNAPYDLTTNPGGPPDGDLDLDWSATTQQQIQDRIVAAVDDYTAGTTEFD